jgi:hypothetical protein
MAGLVPAIHAFVAVTKKDVDARHKAGHDDALRAPGSWGAFGGALVKRRPEVSGREARYRNTRAISRPLNAMRAASPALIVGRYQYGRRSIQ